MSKKKKTPDIIKKIQDFKPKFIDHKSVKSFSYSQLSTYFTCPLKWKLSTIDKINPYTPTIHTIFGTAIHETIQKYLSIYYNETLEKAKEFDIVKYFYTKLRLVYQKEKEKNNNVHVTTPEELEEFFEDGCEILRYLKSKVKSYFGKKDYYLVGCEIPLQYSFDNRPSSIFTGYIDLVIYHEPTNTITLYDLKTSTSGWRDDKKKDLLVTSQLLIYKKLFSDLFDFPIENIQVEYFILKRKINEDCEFVIKRIQKFIPSQGKNKLKQSYNLIDLFLEQAHTEKGLNIEGEYEQKISSKSCKFCQYNNTKYCQL